MTTIQDSKVMQEVSLNAYLARDLFDGTSLMACRDEGLSTINGIALSVADGVMKVVATDRYRMLTGDIEVEDKDNILDQLLIPLRDVKIIISAIKSLPKRMVKDPILNLTRVGDVLTVELVSVTGSATCTVLLGDKGEQPFPPYSHLLNRDRLPVSVVSFNPQYMADFSKVATSNPKGSCLNVTFTGEGYPMEITIPHDKITWKGLLMPMRG